MECGSCGCDNPEQAKLCLECGQAFALRCASCATDLPAGAKLCLECGAPTSAPRPAAEQAPSGYTPEQYDPRPYTPRHLADKILQSRG